MKKKSKNIDDFYLNDYEQVMNSGAVGVVWRQIHKQIEMPFMKMVNFKLIEVGSGNGQHFNLTKLRTSEYLEVDFREAINSNLDLEKAILLGRRFIIGDANLLDNIADESFDGLLATCLLAHLPDLEIALENWRRVIRPGGKLSIYIPNEPGILLRFARRLTTRKKFSKRGYDHEYINWREHRNHFPAMRSSIQHVFSSDQITIKNFPFSFFPWDLGLYSLVTINLSSNSVLSGQEHTSTPQL
jgi:phosphatidylethanolamine/phosphatidyl-N-methylethanolamine N-methyltransferase